MTIGLKLVDTRRGAIIPAVMRRYKSRDESPDRNEILVALRFKGEEREILRIVEQSGEFNVFPPDRRPTALKMHSSYHVSGQRHIKIESETRWPSNYVRDPADGFPADVDFSKPPPKYRYISHLQPTSTLRGLELIEGSTLLPWLFQSLPTYDRMNGTGLLLDADAAQFRDDSIYTRVFLIEPGLEPNIPNAVDIGPKLVHVIRSVKPWIGIAFFQQRSP